MVENNHAEIDVEKDEQNTFRPLFQCLIRIKRLEEQVTSLECNTLSLNWFKQVITQELFAA